MRAALHQRVGGFRAFSCLFSKHVRNVCTLNNFPDNGSLSFYANSLTFLFSAVCKKDMISTPLLQHI